MAKKQKTTEPTSDETTTAHARRTTKRATASTDGGPTPAPTLADAIAGYLKSLEDENKSIGTIASYRAELVLAGSALGVDSPIAVITAEQVLAFFTSDKVMRKRNGRAKSPLSIDKTRRVLRQALVWAETAGMLKEAPVPERLASH